MIHTTRLVVLLPPLVALSGCATEVLPPPAIPDRVAPQVLPRGEPPPGTGYLSIDSVGEGATRVMEAKPGTTLDPADDDEIDDRRYGTVCVETPCVATLPIGTHDLVFARGFYREYGGHGKVTVTQTPSAYRYALGYTAGAGAKPFAAANVVIWGTLAVVGCSILMANYLSDPGPRGVEVLPAVAGVGGLAALAAGVVVLGVVMFKLAAPRRREGSGVQWDPAARRTPL